MLRRAVFLDLNGTLVTPILVNHPRELKPIDGAADAVARLCAAGFVCPVITVQSRIEKGLFTEADFLDWFATFREEMRARGAFLEGPYVCPHRPRSACDCAKPNALLYERAAADLAINLIESFVIGDTPWWTFKRQGDSVERGVKSAAPTTTSRITSHPH